MISCGIDTHLKIHQVEVQNERRKVMWKGQIGNNRKCFYELLEKLRTIERSNSDSIAGVFINPTGTYHMPIQHFLETNGCAVYYIDARVTESARMASNLGKVKSDKVDVHLLASAPWG
jgi:transposase